MGPWGSAGPHTSLSPCTHSALCRSRWGQPLLCGGQSVWALGGTGATRSLFNRHVPGPGPDIPIGKEPAQRVVGACGEQHRGTGSLASVKGAVPDWTRERSASHGPPYVLPLMCSRRELPAQSHARESSANPEGQRNLEKHLGSDEQGHSALRVAGGAQCGLGGAPQTWGTVDGQETAWKACVCPRGTHPRSQGRELGRAPGAASFNHKVWGL